MNRLVLWLLARSVIGRPAAQRLVGLRVHGRLSGRVSTFPVQYATDDEGLVVMPGHHEAKTWWRNLRTDTPLEVLWQGRWCEASGRVIWPWDAEYFDARTTYLMRWSQVRADFQQPFVRISLR